MKVSAVSLLVAGLLFAGSAGAANVEAKGKNTPSPSSSSSGEGEGGGIEGTLETDRGDQAEAPHKAEPEKPWGLGALWETHRLIRQDDLGGDASSKAFNFLYLLADWDVTENNRLGLRFGAYQRFLADDGETGVRADDLVLAYTRRFPLPQGFTARAILSATAPTSFYSQKASLITSPRLALGMTKRLQRFTFDLRLRGSAYITKYREMEGGNPNEKYSFDGLVEADFRFPVLEFLKFGGSVYTGWNWYYDVADAQQRMPTAASAVYPNQPVQQSYGGEIFLRADLPNLGGIKSDLSLALAQGDPTMGYTSTLHDGVGHTYAFWRHSSEVYVTLGARY